MINDILPFPKHRIYCEVFAGSAVVLFNKVESQTEIMNDINSRLVNMWRAVKEARREFIDYCRNEGGIDSHELFNQFKNNEHPYYVFDGARFFYINQHSFSQMNTAFHGMSLSKKPWKHRLYLNKCDNIDQFADRIKNVTIENQDFRHVIKRFDVPDALLYIDPPYFTGGGKYTEMIGRIGEEDWSMKDFEDLRELLKNLKHAKFVLSIDNKEFFKDDNWFYQPITRKNLCTLVTDDKPVKDEKVEYIIRNFDPKKTEVMKKDAIHISNDMDL